MSVVINSNIAASVASNNLAYSTSMLQASLNKLSSGSKIVNPADDAGGLAVAMKLSATVNREGDLRNNISNSTSFLQTQDGALSVASSVLDRMSQLETLYQDPTKNSSDKANYDDEFTQLQSELTNLSSATFNGVSLFASATGSSLSVYTDDQLTSSQAVSVSQQAFSDSSSGVGAVTATGVTSLGSTGFNLATITTAIQNVATMRANNGAQQSRLGFASTQLATNETNLASAVSNIKDVDVAKETTNLAKWNVLVQAGTAMLSQANQSAQIALKLIG